MTVTAYDQSLKGVIIISEDSIRSISIKIAEFTESECEITIEFDDGYSFSSKDPEEIISSSFFRTNFVKRLSFKSSNSKDDNRRIAIIRLNDDGKIGSASIHLSCQNGSISPLKDAIARELKPTSAPYAFFYRQNDLLVMLIWATIGVVLVCGPVSTYIGSFIEPTPTRGQMLSLRSTLAVFGVALGFILSWLFGKALLYLCPPFVIRIGLGDEKAKARSDYRRRLVWIPITLIVAGLIKMII